jgi:hypothetical protein
MYVFDYGFVHQTIAGMSVSQNQASSGETTHHMLFRFPGT